MKKTEFVKNVTNIVRGYEKDGEKLFDVTLKETDAYMNAFKEAVLAAMADGDEVAWPGLVKFTVLDVAPHTARNPRSGETIDVPAKKKVRVKALGELKTSV